jgi:TRAP-type transport system periplasmic protein
MSFSRRTLLKAAAASAVVSGVGAPFVARAQTAEFSYKYANNLPLAHPMNTRAKEMADVIRADSKGRVSIEIFPNNQLGSDTDMLSQVRSGGIEFFTLSGLILSTLVPAASITGIGFAFSSYDEVWKALDGDLGAYVRKEISKSGLVAMDRIWDNGFRQITSSTKPIQSADDLKAFEASPASINFSEVYSALQSKVVDGQENPLAIIATAKLYEVQKYCSLTNHMWDGFWFLANGKAWERLPGDLREIVVKNVNAAGLKERGDVAALNAGLQSDLAGKGMAFNQPQAASFREKLRKAGFYSEWKGKYGDEAWAILERNTGKLA